MKSRYGRMGIVGTKLLLAQAEAECLSRHRHVECAEEPIEQIEAKKASAKILISVSLPDGSTLELNSNSAARIDYSEQARVILLERGEAYFKVVHDPRRPFLVVSNSTWVRDLGTAFDVDQRAAGVRITVSEGSVQVGTLEASGSRVPPTALLARPPLAVLAADQQVDMQGSAETLRTLPIEDVSRAEAWRSGSLYFQKRPLCEVVGELSRYSTLELIVDDPKLCRLPIGGNFQTNPRGIDALLTMLKDGFGLTVRREDRRVYIEGDATKAGQAPSAN